MKTNRLYCLLCAGVVTLLFACSGRKQLPSLEESYSRSDKNPFGTYVAFRQVNELFYRNDVRVKKVAVDKSLDDFNDTSSLYISICRHFYLRRTERNALLSYAGRGNNVFISTRDFDSSFLKDMGISINDSAFYFYPSIMEMKYTGAGLAVPYFADSSLYGYYYNPVVTSFRIKPGTENVRVLGNNENGQPNFIVLFYGKGRFYLHCEPRLFSNYFLLQDKNYKYLEQVFSLMPPVPDNVFWDDYYTRRDYRPADTDDSDKSGDGDRSGFSVLLKYPAMAWAFWLTLLLLFIYLLFGGKRRQRIIKPIPQTENTSVAFTETVGRLYLQKKDNRNIADKMITYLLEHIRNQYFISTNNLNDDFTAMLSRKSNVPYGDVQKMIAAINGVQRMEEVEDGVLLSLNQQIENFYKNKS